MLEPDDSDAPLHPYVIINFSNGDWIRLPYETWADVRETWENLRSESVTPARFYNGRGFYGQLVSFDYRDVAGVQAWSPTAIAREAAYRHAADGESWRGSQP